MGKFTISDAALTQRRNWRVIYGFVGNKGLKCGSSGRIRTYNPSVNSRMLLTLCMRTISNARPAPPCCQAGGSSFFARKRAHEQPALRPKSCEPNNTADENSFLEQKHWGKRPYFGSNRTL